MEDRQISFLGKPARLIRLDTAVVGSGCAGYNAADWLYDLGRRDVAILTEGILWGTSRNTGSDKQTYYKLSLASDGADSVREMAETLFSGEGVQGDIALAEAANSVRCFMKLANLGVPFPTNSYGEYVGYKTDHDPRQRATSAGPLTSKYMTEALEESVQKKGIPVLDHIQAVKLIVSDNRLAGMAGWDTRRHQLVLVSCNQLILATGGPAGIYGASVYPESQTGGSGLAIEAGAVCANLQEWQYGLASLAFRWNVSGSYQQVLPRYISVDARGKEREFLPAFFHTPQEALLSVFQKGYQWPFDAGNIGGSSRIDLLVYRETVLLGRRVYLDYRRNPDGLEQGFDQLPGEAYSYLEQSNALGGTPAQRLARMNPQALALYRSHGIDLYRQPLEIGLCVQHHNGGIAVDSHWESSIAGLYVAGEAAGTFGVRRPGGTALNSTQVGSMRAAEQIASRKIPDTYEEKAFLALAEKAAAPLWQRLERCLSALTAPRGSNVLAIREEMQRQMSRFAAQFRYPQEISRMRREWEQTRAGFFEQARISSVEEIGDLLKTYDLLFTQLAVLDAMEESCHAAGSRGSSLVIEEGGIPVMEHLPLFSYRPRQEGAAGRVLLTRWTQEGPVSSFQPVRPIPSGEDWFEKVWGEYRERTRFLPGRRTSQNPEQ